MGILIGKEGDSGRLCTMGLQKEVPQRVIELPKLLSKHKTRITVGERELGL